MQTSKSFKIPPVVFMAKKGQGGEEINLSFETLSIYKLSWERLHLNTFSFYIVQGL